MGLEGEQVGFLNGRRLDVHGALTELAPEVPHLDGAGDVHVADGAEPIVATTIDAVDPGFVSIVSTKVTDEVHVGTVGGVHVGQGGLLESGAVVLLCPPGHDGLDAGLLSPAPLPVVRAFVEDGPIVGAVQVDHRNVLGRVTGLPVVVGHGAPHGTDAAEGFGCATSEAVAHVATVGVAAAVGAIGGVAVFGLQVFGQLNQELHVGFGSPVEVGVPVVVARSVGKTLGPHHTETFGFRHLAETAEVVHAGGGAEVAVQDKDEWSSEVHVFRRVVDVLAGGGDAVDFGHKRVDVATGAILLSGPLDVVEGHGVSASRQGDAASGVSQGEAVVAIGAFVEGEGRFESWDGGRAAQGGAVPAIAPGVHGEEEVASIFETDQLVGGAVVCDALVGGDEFVVAVFGAVQFP